MNKLSSKTETHRAETYPHIDLLKFLCALLVLMSHASPFSALGETANIYIVNLSFRFAVPFFFISGGFFLFSDPFLTWKKLLRYLQRILILYFFWTVIYRLFHLPYTFSKDALFRFVFSGSTDVFWYFPSLIFSTALTYVLVKKTPLPVAFCIAIALYVLGLSANSYWGLLRTIPLFSEPMKAYNMVFEEAKRGVLFPTIFILFGVAIAKYKERCTWTGIRLPLLVLFCYVLFALEFRLITERRWNWGRDMTVMIIPVSVGLFLLVARKTETVPRPAFLWLRKMSTVVYCSHALVIEGVQRLLQAEQNQGNAPLFFGLTLVLTLLISAVVVWLAKWIKPLRLLY